MKFIVQWIYKPAKWYQFWLPSSGFTGGIIANSIVIASLSLWRYYG